MGQMNVSISDAGGDITAVSPGGRLLTTSVPESYKFYFHTIFDVPGVVAANNFLSVFNPAGSGKTLVFFVVDVSAYAIAASGGSDSMIARRISAASGGTQIAESAVNRFLTSEVNPIAEVRVGNPAVTTVGTGLAAWQPPQSTGAGGAVVQTQTAPGEGFVCLEGEGVVLNTASGDTDQRWKITIDWAEF